MNPQFVDVGSLATLAGTVLVILIFTALFKEVLKAFGMKKPGRYAPIFAIALGVMIQVTLAVAADKVTAIAILLAFLNGGIAAYAAMKTYESHLET